MYRIAHVTTSLICTALLVTGCNSSPGEIVRSTPGSSAPGAATDQPARADLTIPASNATTAATGITSWVLHSLPDGGQALQGVTAHGLRFQIESPRYAARTAGSLAMSVFDDAGHETQGWITVVDGKTVDSSLPAGAADLAQRMKDDLASAPAPYNWNDCNAARSVEASAAGALVLARAAVVAAGLAFVLACVSPAVVAVAPCAAATAAAAAAGATELSAESSETQASNAVHSACDNLCTDNSWCTSHYGAGNWSCNSEGTCEQATSTVCFQCQTVTCGWDFTCVTTANPAPTYCGDCGGGGGGNNCNEDECLEQCEGTGLCTSSGCECGT